MSYSSSLCSHSCRYDHSELDVWVSEIKLRACVRISQLSRELDKAPTRLPETITSHRREVIRKAAALADAGLRRSTANDYERLSTPPQGEQKQMVAAAGMDCNIDAVIGMAAT